MKNIKEYLPTKFWLMKSEPHIFSFEDLKNKGSEFWDGVRNYQARNFMLQEMQVGHKVLFYHSNTNMPGVAGICEVIEQAKPDLTALNPNLKYYDANASHKYPRWYGVTVGKPKTIHNFVPLMAMRGDVYLENMLLLRKGQRLSILPLSKQEFERILFLANNINKE